MADTNITVRLIDEASRGLADINRNVENIDRSSESLTRTFNGLKTAALGFVAAIASKATLDFVDTVQSLDNKLKLVTKSQEEFADAYNTVYKIAQNTRQPLNETVDLYSKLARSADMAKISQQEVGVVTESFNKLLAIAGASGPAAAGAITQFAQAMQSGKFQGDEFRTITEVMPNLLDTVAKYSGIARESLKEYASKGLLTAEIVTLSLIEAQREINSQFDTTSKTVRQAITQMSNAFTDLGRTFLDQSGSASGLVSVIDHITANMGNLVDIAKVAGLALGALAVVFAPVTAALVAAGAAVVYFAEPLGELARTILDLLGKALDYVVPKLAGFGAAIEALLEFENPFTAYADAATKAEQEIGKTNTAQQSLNGTTASLSETTKEAVVQSDRMADAKKRAGITALEAKNAYTEFIDKLKEEVAVAGLDIQAKERQIAINKALEAEAKRIKGTLSDISAERRAQIEAEVGALVTQLQAEKTFAEEVKKLVDEVKKKREEYDKFVKDSQTANLSQAEIYHRDYLKIINDFNDGVIRSEEDKQKILAALNANYQKSDIDALKNYRRQGLTENDIYFMDLRKIYEKYNTEELRQTEGFRAAVALLNEKYQEKDIANLRNFRSSNLTETEKYLEDLKRVNDKYNLTDLEDGEGHLAAKALLLKQYQDKTIGEARAFRDSERNAEQIYADKIKEITDKKNQGLYASDADYKAMLRKANKEYIDGTVNEYSNLYSFLGDKLSGFLGISREKWGLITDVVKLFGIDTQSILKQAFTAGIEILKGFASSGSLDMSSLGSVITNVFSKSTTDVSGFVDGATKLFSGFSSSITSIFSGIGNFLSGLFSSGGSLFSAITSGFSAIINFVTSSAKTVSDTVSSIVSGVSTATNAAAAATNIAAGTATAAGATTVLAAGGGAAAATSMAASGLAEAGGLAVLGEGAGAAAAATGAAGAGSSITAALGSAGILAAGLAIGGVIYNAIKKRQEKNRFEGAKRDAFNFQQAADELKSRGITLASFGGSTFGLRPMNTPLSEVQRQVVDEAYVKSKFANVLDRYKLINYNDLLMWWLSGGKEEHFAQGQVSTPTEDVAGAAKGAVLSRPIAFPVDQSGMTRMGMAGEAGPEAILPLRRTQDGQLGVLGSTGSMNINFTINAVDARGIEQVLIENKATITNVVRQAIRTGGLRV